MMKTHSCSMPNLKKSVNNFGTEAVTNIKWKEKLWQNYKWWSSCCFWWKDFLLQLKALHKSPCCDLSVRLVFACLSRWMGGGGMGWVCNKVALFVLLNRCHCCTQDVWTGQMFFCRYNNFFYCLLFTDVNFAKTIFNFHSNCFFFFCLFFTSYTVSMCMLCGKTGQVKEKGF